MSERYDIMNCNIYASAELCIDMSCLITDDGVERDRVLNFVAIANIPRYVLPEHPHGVTQEIKDAISDIHKDLDEFLDNYGVVRDVNFNIQLYADVYPEIEQFVRDLYFPRIIRFYNSRD